MEMKNNERQRTKDLTLGTIVGLITGITFTMLFGPDRTLSSYYRNYLPENVIPKDLNKDSLPDLIYKFGKKYLQTPEGNFIPYTKEKADSLYKIYQNKLEKEVKEK